MKFASAHRQSGTSSTASSDLAALELVLPSLRARSHFCLISKLYRQMYADTGISTDSARMARSTKIASWLAKPCRLLFAGRPMPDLEVPSSPGLYPEPELVSGD